MWVFGRAGFGPHSDIPVFRDLAELEARSLVWSSIREIGYVAARESRQNPAIPLGLLSWQIRCVEGRRSVRFASQRSKSEIPGGNMFSESKLIHNCEVLSLRKCGRQ
jgi:hypothetical protein